MLNMTEFQEAATQFHNNVLEAANSELLNDLAYAEESLEKVYEAFDQIGWQEIEEVYMGKEPSLQLVHSMSQACRDMVHNPFVKRGVNARISYVWGRGVQFDKLNPEAEERVKKLHKKLFTSQVLEERERAAATDGNVFTIISSQENENPNIVLRVPIQEITGLVADPDDTEQVIYYKRQKVVETINPASGASVTKEVAEYIPSVQRYNDVVEYNLTKHRSINKIPVRWDLVMLHDKVNSMVGWKLGIPDVAAVVFFAKKYKEYLEDNSALVKVYARLAYQVKGNSRQGLQSGPAQFRRPPERDPVTGKPLDIGGIAFTGRNTELAPLPPTGSQVDFSKGVALATAIASGLEVSLVVITSDPGSGTRATAETLDLPTLKAMESRQNLWVDSFKELFEYWGDEDIEVTFPPIYSETTKDRVSALGTLVELNILYAEEARKEALDILGIAPYKPWDELPENKINEQSRASIIPGQGVSGGISAQGGGLHTQNEARDNRSEDENKQ